MLLGTVDTLLQAIAVDPADDSAWLALADCLEESGEESEAELTRLREWLRFGPENEERSRCERRLQRLLTRGVRPVVPRLRMDLDERTLLDMVLIPPGHFWMGSPSSELGRDADESPQHWVRLTRGYWLGTAPVTQAQWQAVMGDNPSRFRGPSRPVEQVGRADCLTFCEEMTRRTGSWFRLPTEAEWEYACRAGTTSACHFGETLTEDLCNHLGRWGAQTTPVGSFPPNAWGLFDMHGNVQEWCGDSKRPYTAGEAIDPAGRYPGVPVARGGSWASEPRQCRSACRWSDPGRRHSFLGFRVALDSRGPIPSGVGGVPAGSPRDVRS